MIRRCVLDKKTLVATFVYDVLKLADVVVVDVQLDYAKNELGNVRNGQVEMTALEESFDIIAHRIPAALPGPHRNHRGAGNHGAGSLAGHEKGISSKRHQKRSADRPQL